MSQSFFRPFSTRSTAAGLSIASNTVLIILKLAAGILTGSVSVIAEAIHSGLDLIAAIIAFISVRTSGRPPDEDHPYGHGKIESISGAAEGVLIFVAAGSALVLGGQPLLSPEVQAGVVGALLLTTVLGPMGLGWVLRREDVRTGGQPH